MKRILFCVLCLSPLFGGPVLYAQQDSSASAPAQSKAAASPVAPRIDPDKEAAIRRFMQLTGSESIGPEIANQIQVLLRPTLEASLPPGEYRAKLIDLFLEKFGTRATTEIIMPMVVSVYAKHFSDEDLKQLIAFYDSPLGRKASSVLPDIIAESRKLQGPSEKLEQECMAQVLTEHPDLEQAMEKADKAHPSH